MTFALQVDQSNFITDSGDIGHTNVYMTIFPWLQPIYLLVSSKEHLIMSYTCLFVCNVILTLNP